MLKGDNEMGKLKEACQVNNWDFKLMEKDFLLYCEYAEMDLEEALEEYIEETLNQGYEG